MVLVSEKKTFKLINDFKLINVPSNFTHCSPPSVLDYINYFIFFNTVVIFLVKHCQHD